MPKSSTPPNPSELPSKLPSELPSKRHDARPDRRAGRNPDQAEIRPAKSCACSGVRSCLRCLDPELRRAYKLDDPLELPLLLRTKPVPDPILSLEPTETEHGTIHAFDPHSQTAKTCPDFSGIRIYPEAVSPSEEQEILAEIEERTFVRAQSGKAKQHFGAKINFNKRRMNATGFFGLPASAKRIENRAHDHIHADRTCDEQATRAMSAFKTTDYFALRYFEAEGSNLDFHSDDRFGYGEAILDLSLESDSVLTFIRPRSRDGLMDCVRVPLPARSIAVLYGTARFDWEHAILAYDIAGRRTSVTLRTLSDEIRETEAGQNILALAENTI